MRRSINLARINIVLLLIVGVLALAILAMRDSRTTDSAGEPVRMPLSVDVIVAQSANVFPVESLEDWTTYADVVAQVTIESEDDLPVSSEALARGEGYIGRTVTLSFDEFLWIRGNVLPEYFPDPFVIRTMGSWFGEPEQDGTLEPGEEPEEVIEDEVLPIAVEH
jgi:hypothetical protein